MIARSPRAPVLRACWIASLQQLDAECSVVFQPVHLMTHTGESMLKFHPWTFLDHYRRA
jgi:hypothetical protein